MPRNYVKKHLRKKYDEKNLQSAIDAVSAGFSLRESSKKYGIPYTTIHRHVNHQVLFNRICRPTKFSIEEEDCLEQTALLLQVNE